jgi:hypothetical protein
MRCRLPSGSPSIGSVWLPTKGIPSTLASRTADEPEYPPNGRHSGHPVRTLPARCCLGALRPTHCMIHPLPPQRIKDPSVFSGKSSLLCGSPQDVPQRWVEVQPVGRHLRETVQRHEIVALRGLFLAGVLEDDRIFGRQYPLVQRLIVFRKAGQVLVHDLLRIDDGTVHNRHPVGVMQKSANLAASLIATAGPDREFRAGCCHLDGVMPAVEARRIGVECEQVLMAQFFRDP